jgi:chromosome segregation ATPase
MESEMLADFLHRNAEQGEDDQAGRPGRGSTGKTQRKSGLPSTLSVDEKYRIANMEVEELHKDIDQTRRTSEQNLDILKALMEETDIRIKEVKRDAYEFRRDIVVGAENIRTGSTMAENVLKYLEDKLTQKDMLINKMLMKNQAYKTQIKKAEKQLKSKQETGDDLQYIDFHQLQIENQQFVVKIDAANQELLTLKRTSGKTVKALNLMKKKLARLTAEQKFHIDEIAERNGMLTKTEADIVKVVEDKENARRDNKKLRVQTKLSPEMPQVSDYVNQKAEFYELEAQLRNWERKVDIAELHAARARSHLREMARQQVH